MRDEIRCAIACEEDRTRQGPGRLVGRILKYGERALDRAELFEVNAFDLAAIKAAGGIVLNRQHERGSPIMRVTPELRGEEIVINAPLPDSQSGRDAALEIREGLMRGLSVSFQASRQTFADGVRRISAATMTAIGLVDEASYGDLVEVRARVRRDGRRRRWQ